MKNFEWFWTVFSKAFQTQLLTKTTVKAVFVMILVLAEMTTLLMWGHNKSSWGICMCECKDALPIWK